MKIKITLDLFLSASVPNIKYIDSDILFISFQQWGSQSSGNNWQVYYPLVFNSAVYGVWIDDYAAKNNNLQYVGVSQAESSLNGFKMYTSTANNIGIAFFAIGR